MRLPSGLKTAAYLFGCLVWLLAGLTLLGPLAGEQFVDAPDGGPSRPLLALVCPARLEAGQTSSIFVRIDNHSGKTQNYSTDLNVQLGEETRAPMSASCDPVPPVADGAIGTTSCAVGPISQVTRVQVTVWAEGDHGGDGCAQGCPDSYRSGCVIMPDVWTMLLQPGALLVNTVIFALGLALVVAGAALWRTAGLNGRFAMAGFFTASALMLALAISQTFGDWIAATLVIGPLPETILMAVLWLRGRPEQ